MDSFIATDSVLLFTNMIQPVICIIIIIVYLFLVMYKSCILITSVTSEIGI